MIDFQNVRSIVIPEGEVAVIARDGEILWQKQSQKYKTELQYLESSGTQWIDTGYAFADDFAWEINFQGMNSGGTLFGGRTSFARTAVLYYGNAVNNNGIPFLSLSVAGFNGNTTPFKLGELVDGRCTIKSTIKSNKASVWVNDANMYSDIAFSGSYISGVSQAIFADNYGKDGVKEFATSKVYWLKMWQGTELVRDFIPVLDLNDVPCMYDKVTDKLFYNQGTGKFTYQ